MCSGVRAPPLAMIGSPAEMVAEIRRRRDEWSVTQVFFPYSSADMMKEIGTEVLPYV